MSKKSKEQIIAMYSSNTTISNISRALCVSFDNVVKVLKEAGVYMPSNRRRRLTPQDRLDTIIFSILKNRVADIANEYQVSPAYIYTLKKKLKELETFNYEVFLKDVLSKRCAPGQYSDPILTNMFPATFLEKYATNEQEEVIQEEVVQEEVVEECTSPCRETKNNIIANVAASVITDDILEKATTIAMINLLETADGRQLALENGITTIIHEVRSAIRPH